MSLLRDVLIPGTQSADRVAASGTVLSSAFTVGASVVHAVNEYLQAGAFIVAIISGLAATFYYVKKR